MSIRSTLISVFLLLLILLGGLVAMSWGLVRSQQAVSDAESRRFESWKLADELRQSSDELTRMARTFVITGDPRYETWFNDILAIRNGERERPVGYDGIYWDFVVAGQSMPTGGHPPLALEERMRRMGFTEAEFANLHEARRRSDALVNMEAAAMAAVKGRFADERGEFTVHGAPDLERARAIMHGPEYHQAKAEIMQPIAQFFAMLDARTAREVLEARHTAQRLAGLMALLGLILVAVTLLSAVLLLRKTLTPIRRMVERLKDIAGGEGDLTARVAEGRRDELGELARWFNAFIDKVREMVGRVARTSGDVASAEHGIVSAATNQQASAAELSGSTSQIAVAVNEIAASGRALAMTTRDVSDTAREAAAAAADGHGGLQQMADTTDQLARATTAIGAKLTLLEARAAGISRIVNTIVRVADQTNVLSLNAALEAEKAQEHGAGFRVVAREIRNLADQTASATLEIEGDVRAIRDAMDDGMREMGRLDRNVKEVVSTATRISAQLGRVIERVQQVSARLAEVDDGISQQAAGIQQINEAIGSLKVNASRGAASAGDFAETSASLSRAVEILEREIARFRIADGRPPSRHVTGGRPVDLAP